MSHKQYPLHLWEPGGRLNIVSFETQRNNQESNFSAAQPLPPLQWFAALFVKDAKCGPAWGKKWVKRRAMLPQTFWKVLHRRETARLSGMLKAEEWSFLGDVIFGNTLHWGGKKKKKAEIKTKTGRSLAVQWLRLHTCNAGGDGWIPGWGTKISHTYSGKKNAFLN